MAPANYDEPASPHNQPAVCTWRDELVTIPNAHCVRETEKALICDLGDGGKHTIAKTQIAPEAEVQQLGDHGTLIITKWLAIKAGLTKFAATKSPWAREPHTR